MSSKDKHTKSQAKQADDREEMACLCSSVDMLRGCGFFSVRSLTVDLQEEGNGKSQDKRIAARFRTSVWGPSYQDPAHSLSVC